MPFVEVQQIIRAPREEVYRLLTRMEDFPQFMKNVRSVRVLERDSTSTVTEWDVDLEGRSFRWQEKDVFDEAGGRIRYFLTQGDLKKWEGEWILESVPDGTRVTLTVDFDLGIPMFAALLHPIAKIKVRENVDAMLEGIRERLESA